jgi:hypothetical protein
MTEDFPDQIYPNKADDQLDWKPYGVSIENLDEPLVLYPARSSAIDALHGRFKLIIPLEGIVFAFAIFVLHWHWMLLVAYSILLALIYLWVRRKYSRAVVPILSMRSDGLEIHSLHYDMFIPWSEIKEVRPFTIIEPHVGIMPYDLKKTLARGTTRTKISGWLNASCVPLYKCVGFFVAPIFLLESELPLSAKEVAEQINMRRTHALGRNPVLELGRDELM